MNGYERIINQMRQQGRYHNPPTIQIGEVGDNKTIKVGDAPLDKDDYLLDCNLTFETDSFFYHAAKNQDSALKEYKRNILKKGDQVLVIKLTVADEDTEQYAVLSKVVEP